MERRPVAPSLLTGIILALGFVAGCWVLASALVDFKAMDRYVSVKGLAEREVAADLAMWPISFSVAADTLPDLDAALARSRGEVMAFLKEQGLDAAEIMNAAPRVQENQYNSPNQRPAHRYTAQAVITVRSNDIATVKKAMSAAGELVPRGVLLVRDYEFRPTFAFTGLNSIKPDMIAEATRNARDAAKQFAEDSGSRVGGIRRASQGYFSLQDRDQYTPEIKKVRVVTSVDYFLED
ncbi:SIMPL domain-containing protein [Desulfovibrio sp. Huiquan2017]|uniref:SIMPL domain-containing protein n=1 Tax=Desulfovibrio sp. Huiquan2017 TaxID=2816861 RepID=UPI001A92AD20|nr:SIMPL domain-containing protein [Desulfovibrio sp. Huiquan2017]